MRETESPLVERSARIVLRPIGNPLPLGFLALAGATLMLSGLQLDWVEPDEGRLVALILLAFAFPLEIVSSVFGLLARDAVAAIGMGVLSGGWLSVASSRSRRHRARRATPSGCCCSSPGRRCSCRPRSPRPPSSCRLRSSPPTPPASS